ncbi:MAG: CRTAC1 family protein [Pirellulaceae bacterium]|nr:CRTAC1 family protein [Pirellulaceae bacterium]
MSQPLDRTSEIQQLGELDEEAGEFWRTNIFQFANSDDNLSAFEPNRLFLNTGQGKRFIDASFNSGANIDSDSRSVIAADINLDGKPDLLVGSVGGGPLRLFLNQVETDNRFLSLQLPEYSGSLVGTRIILHTSSHLIYRDLFPVNACLGQSPINTTFGIPAGVTVDRGTIRWPNGNTISGAVSEQNGALQFITEE